MALTAEEQAELDQLEAGMKSLEAGPPPDLPMEVPEEESGGFIQGAKDFATKGNVDYQFDKANVATSAGIGAGIGAAVGLPAGPPGMALGALAGGALGAMGGVAEESAKVMGASDLGALLASFAAGGIPSLVKSGATSLARSVTPSSAAYLPRWARGALGLGKEMGQEGMTAAERKALDATLGKKVDKIDFEASPTFNNNQKLLKDQLAKNGVKVPDGTKVSDFTREKLYSTMDMLRTKGAPFINSMAFKELDTELAEQLALKQINRTDVDTIRQLARNQIDKRPAVVAQSNNSLLNLAQNGGKFNNKTGEAEKLISDKAQELLANKFNKYFDETGQGELYNTLKSVERSEIVAKTVDELPLVFLNKASPKQLKEISSNIKATPEGKKLFVDSMGSYLSGIPVGNSAKTTGERVMSEFKRLAPTLKESGILSAKELNETQMIIAAIPKTLSAARWKEIADSAIASALKTGVPSAIGQGRETE